jgi:hypothetical protein
MSVVVVSKPRPREPQHFCKLPKWKTRRKMAVQLHTIVRCDECAARYQWVRGTLELGAHWEPVR